MRTALVSDAPILCRQNPLVAIGASAGGPTALAQLLSNLPGDFSAPVVIVQHLDAQFADGLARWLDAQTPLQVRLARDDDQPKPGTVLIAGRARHLVFVSPTRVGYTRTPANCPYQPSIDVFFKTTGQFWRGRVIGVVLTGMGRDGAEGLRGLRQGGHHTIVQDPVSSAVYGMPRAAIELRAATEILPLDKIWSRLRNMVAQEITVHG